MKTLRSLTFVTMDDLPITASVSDLDRVARYIGGKRGYGGKPGYPAGHWIKLTNVKKSEKMALVNRIDYWANLREPLAPISAK